LERNCLGNDYVCSNHNNQISNKIRKLNSIGNTLTTEKASIENIIKNDSIAKGTGATTLARLILLAEQLESMQEPEQDIITKIQA
jgi:hypothetical protein